MTNPEDSEETRIRRHTLATSIVLLAQGIPFIHGGQEFLRTKRGVENSYKSPDEINCYDWQRQDAYRQSVEFVKGLIHLRKSHYLFRLRDTQTIENSVKLHYAKDGIIAYSLVDSQHEILVIINGNQGEKSASIDKGDWQVLVRNMKVSQGTETISLQKGYVNVDSLSALVLKRNLEQGK